MVAPADNSWTKMFAQIEIIPIEDAAVREKIERNSTMSKSIELHVLFCKLFERIK